MANRRMINSGVWCDEKFLTFDDVTRLVWFGIITTADDQGRLQDNPLLIKAQLFPADRKSASLISKSLDRLTDAGMITRYEKDGKSLVQIVNWWEHQSPAWASESDYPAPDNWIDRVKVHAKGGGIQKLNWELDGGYVESELPDTQALCSDYVAPTLPDTQSIEKVKVKNEVKLTTTTGAAAVFSAYESEIGMLTGMVRELIVDALSDYPDFWIVEAIQEAASQNKRNWKYCDAILKRWQVDGFKVDTRKKRNGNGKKPKEPDLGGYEVDRTSEVILVDDGEVWDGDLQF